MLILVRHGRTEANAAGLLQGRRDLPLDELGRAQAAAIAEFLGPVGKVISSPLLRARETAARLTADEVVVDDRFVELDYGDLDGRGQSEVPFALWETWRSDPSFAPPGGESLVALQDRVAGALADLAPRAMTDDIVVVSHVSPMKAAVAWALGCPFETVTWRCRLDVASICRIAVTARGPMLMSFNETAHLAGIVTSETSPRAR